MKEVKIKHPDTGEEIVVVIKPINVKSAAQIMNRVSSLFKRAEDDKNFRMALNGLVSIVGQEQDLNGGLMIMILPHIITNFFDELIDLVSDLTKQPREVIEELQIEELMEIVATIVEVNDFEKVKALLKNFSGIFKNKLPAPAVDKK